MSYKLGWNCKFLHYLLDIDIFKQYVNLLTNYSLLFDEYNKTRCDTTDGNFL